MNAYWNVGFEMSTELTYPSPESTATGMLMSVSQIMGVLSTLLIGWLFANYGSYWALASQFALLVIGSVVTSLIPNKLRRQAAFRGDNKNAMFELIGTGKETPVC